MDWRASLVLGTALTAFVLLLPATNAAQLPEDPPKTVKTLTVTPPPSIDQSSAEEGMPVISADIEALPPPVRRMRAHIMKAARTGDIGQLRAVIQANEFPPSVPGESADPIESLKSVSGDPDGREMLAIMMEVLEFDYAHIGKGTNTEMYVWPYLAALPFENLSPEQEVDLYRIITPGDREEMEIYGRYNFFRLGIGPDGVWHYFLTGD